jgi:hypothetical protein
MPINKFLYFGDFFAIPVAVTVLAYFALTAGGLWSVSVFGISLLTGLVTWTVVEYAIHRFVYHRAPLFSALHDSHHQAPDEFIGVPSFVSSGVIIVVCYFPVRMLDDVAASGFTSGMLLGTPPTCSSITGPIISQSSLATGSTMRECAIITITTTPISGSVPASGIGFSAPLAQGRAGQRCPQCHATTLAMRAM